jgi:hypothetical protein
MLRLLAWPVLVPCAGRAPKKATKEFARYNLGKASDIFGFSHGGFKFSKVGKATDFAPDAPIIINLRAPIRTMIRIAALAKRATLA